MHRLTVIIIALALCSPATHVRSTDVEADPAGCSTCGQASRNAIQDDAEVEDQQRRWNTLLHKYHEDAVQQAQAAGGDNTVGDTNPDEPAQPSKPTLDLDRPFIDVKVVEIPGGQYKLGMRKPINAEDGESPQRSVLVDPFHIDAYEVSNSQFLQFVKATKFKTESEAFGWSFVFEELVPKHLNEQIQNAAAGAPWWIPVPGATWMTPAGPQSNVFAEEDWRGDHPVVHVSYNDAQAYCKWRDMRLPTEAEWEVASRGGKSERLFPWGNVLSPRGEHRCNIWQGAFPKENLAEDGYTSTAPIDTYKPNGYGLYNTVGNVWEWVHDYWSPRQYGAGSPAPLNNPTGPPRGTDRVKKGGSYMCNKKTCFRYHNAARSHNTADTGASNLGFRCARSAAGGAKAKAKEDL